MEQEGYVSANWFKGVEPPCDGEYVVVIKAKEGAPFVIKGEVRLATGWFTEGKGWYLSGYSNGNATEYKGVWEVVGWQQPTPIKLVCGKI